MSNIDKPRYFVRQEGSSVRHWAVIDSTTGFIASGHHVHFSKDLAQTDATRLNLADALTQAHIAIEASAAKLKEIP